MNMYPRISENTSPVSNAYQSISLEQIRLMLCELEPADRSEFMRGLRIAFEQDAKNAKQNLALVAEQLDLPTLNAVAYKMAISSRSVGATLLSKVCDQVVRMIESNCQIAALNTIPRLQSEIDKVQRELVRTRGYW